MGRLRRLHLRPFIADDTPQKPPSQPNHSRGAQARIPSGTAEEAGSRDLPADAVASFASVRAGGGESAAGDVGEGLGPSQRVPREAEGRPGESPGCEGCAALWPTWTPRARRVAADSAMTQGEVELGPPSTERLQSHLREQPC